MPSFEEQVVRMQKEVGWSDRTLLSLFLDYFWTTKKGKTVEANVLKHLGAKRDEALASKKSIKAGSIRRCQCQTLTT